MSGTETKRRHIREHKCTNNTCARCGGQFNYWQLDLHHPDETLKHPFLKTFRGRAKGLAGLPIKQFWIELEKCIVVCKNCHADIHYYES